MTSRPRSGSAPLPTSWPTACIAGATIGVVSANSPNPRKMDLNSPGLLALMGPAVSASAKRRVPMATDIANTMKELGKLTVPQLKQRYAEVFGEPTRTNHKRYLIKRIIWRMQAIEQGGLSERAMRRAAELADDSELRLTAPRARETQAGPVVTAAFDAGRSAEFPKPGAVLRREYKGRTILVKVLPRGFEYEGEVFRSLTAVARHITGAHWNGVNFFGLPSSKRRARDREAG